MSEFPRIVELPAPADDRINHQHYTGHTTRMLILLGTGLETTQYETLDWPGRAVVCRYTVEEQL